MIKDISFLMKQLGQRRTAGPLPEPLDGQDFECRKTPYGTHPKNMEDWYVGNIGLLEWLLLHVQQYSLYLIYSRCESLDHYDFK